MDSINNAAPFSVCRYSRSRDCTSYVISVLYRCRQRNFKVILIPGKQQRFKAAAFQMLPLLEPHKIPTEGELVSTKIFQTLYIPNWKSRNCHGK